MGTYGTKPGGGGGGGGSFGTPGGGGPPGSGGGGDIITCDPLAVMIEPIDPPYGPPPKTPYDKTTNKEDRRSYDEWVKNVGCGTMSLFTLNINEFWDDLRDPNYPDYDSNGGFNTLPNVFSNDNFNEYADCCKKNGINVRKGRWSSIDLLKKMWECKMELFQNKFGVNVGPGGGRGGGSGGYPEILKKGQFLCPPLCKGMDIDLSWNQVIKQCWWEPNYQGPPQKPPAPSTGPTLADFKIPPHGTTGEVIFSRPGGDGGTVKCDPPDNMGHCVYCKVVSCNPESVLVPGGRICVKCVNGYPQGGGTYEFCFNKGGELTPNPGKFGKYGLRNGEPSGPSVMFSRGECERYLKGNKKTSRGRARDRFRGENNKCAETWFDYFNVHTIIYETPCEEEGE